jgi:hypothetical protein
VFSWRGLFFRSQVTSLVLCAARKGDLMSQEKRHHRARSVFVLHPRVTNPEGPAAPVLLGLGAGGASGIPTAASSEVLVPVPVCGIWSPRHPTTAKRPQHRSQTPHKVRFQFVSKFYSPWYFSIAEVIVSIHRQGAH